MSLLQGPRGIRRPFGLHLELVEVIGHRKVMQALMKLENKHPGVGVNLVQIFFPGKLLADEERFWEEKAQEIVR